MNFKSDNTAPVNPEILQTIMDTNDGFQSSYGQDDYSKKLQKRFSEIFNKDVIVYLTNTGTVANSLALSTLVRPYEAIFCSDEAHVYTDECSAPELYTSGARLVPIKSFNGKINLDDLEKNIKLLLSFRPHKQKPGCLTITQATEYGTVYTQSECETIATLCKNYGLPLHMDGARFTNSLASLNCHPSEITWKVGVDVMSFGATKNGALCAEAIVFFNPKYAENFDYTHKRAGQLMSKTRFFACQFLAYFENGLWLNNAKQANLMASKLSNLFKEHGITPIYPVDANEVFVHLTLEQAQHLRENGAHFYAWGSAESNTYRFVTSWMHCESEIDQMEDCLEKF